MRILYFTDGAGIDLQEIRESVLRIPEVLASLRKGQEQTKYVDLMQVMALPDEDFSLISSVLRNFLINLVQRGLHQRWVNRDQRADVILRRINFRFLEEVKAELMTCLAHKSLMSVKAENLHLLHFINKIEITIIGPGFDQLEMWLRKEICGHLECEVEVKDVIASDPQLEWFWPQVSEALIEVDRPIS